MSGTITAGNILVGDRGSGTLNMTGGTITDNGLFRIGHHPTSIGHVNLYGGIINTTTFDMRGNAGAVGTMDVRAAGTLIINGDNVSAVQGYIDSGWITAYDGNGTLQLDYDVTNKGKTTLKAVHMLNPNPADGDLLSAGEVELSWTLPDPCVPGQPVPVDVYFTDNLKLLEDFTDPAAIQIVSRQNVTSVAVQTQPKTRYYWAVDTYVGGPDDPVFGPTFSFYADNMPPEVNAGSDVVTWLEDGPRTGNLDATVTDDDAYTLQLEAFDGEYTGSDTVTINLYNDSCQAAQSLPDYVPLVGDLNGDCKVDDVDMAFLEENWLLDNSLTEEWFLLD